MFFDGSPLSFIKPKLSDLNIALFHLTLIENNFNIDHCFIHASYFINLANQVRPKIYNMSFSLLDQQMERAKFIGIKTIILHPGSSIDKSLHHGAIVQVAKALNELLTNHEGIVIALETMSGKGSQICASFQELKQLLDLIDNQAAIGVCWDTCHLWDSGWDLDNDLEKMIDTFDKLIGLDKLKVIHLNNSKFALANPLDRHDNLATGQIKLSSLLNLVTHPKLQSIPIILETPCFKHNLYAEEIQLIKNWYYKA